MKRDTGFGLRDVVAVLCLAGLALPILAASLGGVVSQAAEVRCRTNLGALTRAVVAYAARNRGYMPVYKHTLYDNGQPAPAAPPQPDRTAVAFGGNKNPVTGLLDIPMNFGHLYVQGLVRSPEMFYCPAPITDTRHTLANYPKPWGSKSGPGSNLIRVGYMFNPWIKIISGAGSDIYATYDDGLVLRRHPGNWPLVCDLVMSMNQTGHRQAGSAFWNMAYPDGHVAPFANQELYDVLASGLDIYRLEWGVFNSQVRPKILPPGP